MPFRCLSSKHVRAEHKAKSAQSVLRPVVETEVVNPDASSRVTHIRHLTQAVSGAGQTRLIEPHIRLQPEQWKPSELSCGDVRYQPTHTREELVLSRNYKTRMHSARPRPAEPDQHHRANQSAAPVFHSPTETDNLLRNTRKRTAAGCSSDRKHARTKRPVIATVCTPVLVGDFAQRSLTREDSCWLESIAYAPESWHLTP